MKKRLISALLVLVLAICVLPVSAFADQPLMNSAYSSQSGYHDIPYGGSHHYVPYGTVISQTYNIRIILYFMHRMLSVFIQSIIITQI